MSKLVKDMITKDLRNRLEGVEDALLVDVIGLENNKNVALRQRLRQKNIHLLVVKNSLARRATEGTRLAPAFETAEGTLAVVWGGEDIIALAKEIVKIAQHKDFEKFKPKGGVMDGQALGAEQVQAVSKWPSRPELLSLVAGQITGVASQLASQLTGPAQQLASQIEKLIEMKEKEGS
jgi:large subunit ribosomal protein L10